MDLSEMLILVAVVVGVLVLLGVAGVALGMWRYRVPPRGVIAIVGALIYLASPIDVLPEAILGPLGLFDDAGAVTAAAVFAYKLTMVKKRLEGAGVMGRRRPDQQE